MKIIKPSVELYGAVPTDYAGALKFIEKAGRTCYKSEDKITEDSSEKFVKKLIAVEHLAMVEHSNFVVRGEFVVGEFYKLKQRLGNYLPLFLEIRGDDKTSYIGGSLTAWRQRIPEDRANDAVFAPFIKQWGQLFGITSDAEPGDWKICPHDEIPSFLHRYSAKFICDRGVSHELVRHRPCSFAQESTRYVNYGGKGMEFIEPVGFESWSEEERVEFYNCCYYAESRYNRMVTPNGRLKPQQARAVLPNALKTELIVTADTKEWKHIKKLRTHKSAHPDMVRLMSMMPWEFLS